MEAPGPPFLGSGTSRELLFSLSGSQGYPPNAQDLISAQFLSFFYKNLGAESTICPQFVQNSGAAVHRLACSINQSKCSTDALRITPHWDLGPALHALRFRFGTRPILNRAAKIAEASDRYTSIRQVYQHQTGIQASDRYTSIRQVYQHQTGIQASDILYKNPTCYSINLHILYKNPVYYTRTLNIRDYPEYQGLP